jgi:HD-GYP domain-containing protein (c-di-GMP phosphodiesterase class II)
MQATVAVEDLRPGMFIHMEGGWLSHPFPLSSFKLQTAEQIATIRRLGLQRVRWSPEKSDVQADSPLGAAAAGAAKAALPAAPAVPNAAAQLAAERRAQLDAQRQAQQQIEAQYGEAGQSWREATRLIGADPGAASAQVQALAAAIVDKMLSAPDVSIRLVPAGGERFATHLLNVTVVSLLLGRSLGLGATDLVGLGAGSLLHDIGKLDLAEKVRHLEDGATAAHIAAYREHVARGLQQGQRMALPPTALAVIAQHHEQADGQGFPLRLAGERIHLAARIASVVNRYDNLCNPPLRTVALTPHEAMAMLFATGRSRFDPTVLNAFIKMMGVYPAGSVVQLTDERFALVVGVNTSRPLKPRVLVHDPRVPRSEALMLDLEQHPDLGIRRSLAASKLPLAALQYLDPRPRTAYYFECLGESAATCNDTACAEPVPA